MNHDNNEFSSQKRKKNARTVTVIGDSMIKEMKGYQMRNYATSNTRIYVKPMSGATTEDMHDYIKPAMRFKPDLFIIHTGTNDLRSGKEPVEIANEIIELGRNAKTDENDVAISELVIRNDELNYKVKKVNELLQRKSSSLGLGFIEHKNIKLQHLNNSGLHLNSAGNKLLSNNFVDYINL